MKKIIISLFLIFISFSAIAERVDHIIYSNMPHDQLEIIFRAGVGKCTLTFLSNRSMWQIKKGDRVVYENLDRANIIRNFQLLQRGGACN